MQKQVMIQFETQKLISTSVLMKLQHLKQNVLKLKTLNKMFWNRNERKINKIKYVFICIIIAVNDRFFLVFLRTAAEIWIQTIFNIFFSITNQNWQRNLKTKAKCLNCIGLQFVKIRQNFIFYFCLQVLQLRRPTFWGDSPSSIVW